MSANMARQGGRVQLELCDKRLALDTAKMAKGGIPRSTIEKTLQPVKMPRAKVRELKKPDVEFPGHYKVKAGIERCPAMLHENQTDSCLPCQNGTAKKSTDTLDAQMHGCTSNMTGATSARNATCAS
jgi:hypothetical protein